jgi:Tol biopolymer transport system component
VSPPRFPALALAVLTVCAVAGTDTAAGKQPPTKPRVRDGMIAFVSDRGGDSAIWAVAASGGSARQLTHPGDREADSRPTFSPDGRQLVFVRESPDYSSALWVARSDGSGAHRLVANVLAASFSPDGRQLAVVVTASDGGNALALVPAAGGTPRVICGANGGTIGSAAFSPAGSAIAYSDVARGIVVAQLGSRAACSTSVLGIAGADDPSYGRDGTLVWDQPSAADAGIEIWMKRPNLHAHRIVGDGWSNLDPVISPAGNRLVFSSDRLGNGTGVYLTDLTGRHIVALGDPQAACISGYCQGDWNPGWQPLR